MDSKPLGKTGETILKKVDMTNVNHWAVVLVAEALKCCPLSTEVVSARMEELLMGQLSSRRLTPTALKGIATELIGDMVPVAAEPEVINVNYYCRSHCLT